MSRSPTSGLSASNLSCRRHDRLLFEHLNFQLEAGQLLEVCGPNGSGKTTLLRLLCGLRQPDEGEVRWLGRAIRSDIHSFRAQFCYVGHRPGLNEDLSPLENLRLEAALFNVPAAGIEAALQSMGIDGVMHLASRQLSAGQRQRAALARLIMRQVPLWILDEPVASLDRAAQAQVMGLLAGHAQNGGMAIFTTHQPIAIAGVDVRQLQLGTP